MHKNSCNQNKTEREELIVLLFLLGYSKKDLALENTYYYYYTFAKKDYLDIGIYSYNTKVYLYTGKGIKKYSYSAIRAILEDGAKCLRKNLK